MRSRGRILVVDDDDTIRALVATALADAGYEVRAAVHGVEALDTAAEWSPDLILLDMRMPLMDCWEFVRAYRGRPGLHAPIVILTAGRDAASIAADVAADGFLAKPFDLDGLLGIVGSTLNGHGAGRPG